MKVIGVADLPTRFGAFRIVAFWNNRDAKEHVAIVRGDIVGAHDVPTRLHSECLTGDAIGSLRCDCRDQLEVALRAIQKAYRFDPKTPFRRLPAHVREIILDGSGDEEFSFDWKLGKGRYTFRRPFEGVLWMAASTAT